MRILFLGDIVGRPGLAIVKERLPELIELWQPDLTIANAENSAAGRGIVYRQVEDLFDAGVEIITMGNHVWDQKDILKWIDEERRVVRPYNFPVGAPGEGYTLVKVGQVQVAVVNLLGRVFMADYDSPFTAIERILTELEGKTQHIFIDFHAEATSEKKSFAYFVDGRVSCVVGTHTHVQTADEQVLPGGTGFLTDVGMCGAYESVLGMDKNLAIRRFVTQMPVRLEVPEVTAQEAQLCGVVIDLNDRGKMEAMERIFIRP